MSKEKLTQEYLLECLTYYPLTGLCFWKERPVHHFKATKKRTSQHLCKWWNNRFADKQAGSFNKKNKNINIFVNSKQYKVHRLSWLYMEGYFPEYEIDHIDRDPSNNKWNNLRHVTGVCNCQNRCVKSTNTSGVTGVYKDKIYNKWVSSITINKKTKYIGSYKNFNNAVLSRYIEERNNVNWLCSTDSSAYSYLIKNDLI